MSLGSSAPTSIRAAGLAALLVAVAPLVAKAQAPSFREVSGHAFGERITVHHEMVRYLERLGETSDRVTVVTITNRRPDSHASPGILKVTQ